MQAAACERQDEPVDLGPTWSTDHDECFESIGSRPQCSYQTQHPPSCSGYKTTSEVSQNAPEQVKFVDFRIGIRPGCDEILIRGSCRLLLGLGLFFSVTTPVSLWPAGPDASTAAVMSYLGCLKQSTGSKL